MSQLRILRVNVLLLSKMAKEQILVHRDACIKGKWGMESGEQVQLADMLEHHLQQRYADLTLEQVQPLKFEFRPDKEYADGYPGTVIFNFTVPDR